MKARTKSIFSIWNKMQKKNVSFDEVMDLFAIRIILDSKPEDEKSDCWTAYSFVTEEYQTNPERLRDWITIPKSNGYESLHTTVMGPQGKWVEIQIRTRRMDEIAEKGLGRALEIQRRKRKFRFRYLAGRNSRYSGKSGIKCCRFYRSVQNGYLQRRNFCLHTKRRFEKIAAGATMLDFAYEIHSEVGDHCVGGKVNGKKVTLKYKLKTAIRFPSILQIIKIPKWTGLIFWLPQKQKTG